jgi:glycosyltransferase involved in cell wall biosynthesis
MILVPPQALETNLLSAIVITFNEEINIARCLKSLSFCNEIIVLDSGSTDHTVKIAESLGAKVSINTSWPGFGIQKSTALNLASYDWILSIDADEVITPNLASEILKAVQQDKIAGFYINRLSNFLGHWMHFGGWHPDYVMRLARRALCHFDTVPLHERLIVQGTTDKLKSHLLHFSYPTIESVLLKRTRYAIASAHLKRTNKRSYGVVESLVRSLWAFTQSYLFRLGFLDGTAGLLAAISRSQETFWKYAATKYVHKPPPIDR